MGVDLRFLPRAAEVLALYARAAAVGLDVVQVVERLEREGGHQLLALERLLRGAELQLDQPPFAGDRVEEPAVCFLRGVDLDDRAAVPIGGAELAQLMNSFFDLVQDAAVPLARLAVAGAG